MARHALADHRAGLHLRLRRHRGDEAREQRRGAMALVIVRAPFDLPRTHRQQRLRAIEGLDLALLVDADHQRLVRRIEIEPDNVAHLLDELWIGRELERLGAVRLQARQMRCTEEADTPDAFAMSRVLQCVAPVGFSSSVLTKWLRSVVADLARRAASGLVAEAIEA